MELTREALNGLIGLQEKDSALDKLAAEIAKVPVEIKALRDALANEKKAMDAARGHTAELEKRKKESELDLSQKEEAIKKHQKELNQVKTNDAFRALQNEIDNAKAEGGSIETRILELMEQLDASRQEEKRVAAELKAVESKCNGEVGVLEGKLKDLQGRHERQKAVRDEAAAAISAEVLKVYTHIRSRGKPDAVVSIGGDSCGACQMKLSPHIIVEATKLKSVVLCESCQRILYRPEALAAKSA